ncbi:hypothetical protein KKA53_02695 [Candidatus Dependentiae bacterium]|nr:hypothetical protein [Candidatus Dependentiae bacterium]
MSNYFSKKVFCLVFITIAIFNQTSPDLPEQTRYPNHPMYSIYANPWRLMEQVFVIEPELNLQKKLPRILQATATIIGAVPGSVWFAKKACEPSLTTHTAGSLVLTVSLSYLLYLITRKSIEKKTYYNVLKNFVVTWANNKQSTPQELHELFDFINEKYINSASESYLKNVTPDVISRVTQVIYEQYPEKYREELSGTNNFPAWLKWTIIALSAAIIVKLATSATTDVLTVIAGKNISDALPDIIPNMNNIMNTLNNFKNINNTNIFPEENQKSDDSNSDNVGVMFFS